MADADTTTGHAAPEGPDTRPSRRPSLVWIVVLALFWWALAHPRPDAWIAGAIAVLTGLLLHVGLGGRSRARPRLRGVAAFVPFFLAQMVRGGLDVSRRALHPALPLDPDLLRFRTGLPEGLPRILLVNVISLLPGTFSARVQDDVITVHRLARDITSPEMLRRLEGRIGVLFGVQTGRGAEDGTAGPVP